MKVNDILLEVQNLHTYFKLEEGLLKAANGEPAIGASVRVSGSGISLYREIQAGSGYWSLNGLAQIVPHGADLNVRFPGGKTVTAKVAAGAKEITISADGTVQSK